MNSPELIIYKEPEPLKMPKYRLYLHFLNRFSFGIVGLAGMFYGFNVIESFPSYTRLIISIVSIVYIISTLMISYFVFKEL